MSEKVGKREADGYAAGDFPDRCEKHDRNEPEEDRLVPPSACLAVSRKGSETDGLALRPDAARHQPGLFLAELGKGAVERGDVPEILDLQGGSVAFDLAGKAEEREVVGCSIRSAAVQHQAAGLCGLLVVFGDFRVGIRAEIGQQLVLVAELDRDGRVFGDFARRLDQLLDEDVDIGGIVLQVVRGGEQALVGGAQFSTGSTMNLPGASASSARRFAASTIDALIVPWISALRRTSDPGT